MLRGEVYTKFADGAKGEGDFRQRATQLGGGAKLLDKLAGEAWLEGATSRKLAANSRC